jgi:hypothetical protein
LGYGFVAFAPQGFFYVANFSIPASSDNLDNSALRSHYRSIVTCALLEGAGIEREVHYCCYRSGGQELISSIYVPMGEYGQFHPLQSLAAVERTLNRFHD